MTLYDYRAKQGPKNIVTGKIDAENRDQAAAKINQLGLFTISIKETKESKQGPLKTASPFSFSFEAKIKTKEREMFTRNLADLLEGGLPLFRALDLLAKETEHKKLKEVSEKIRDQVKEGAPLSAACSQFPQAFPSLYTNMIHAGEVGGMLDKVLRRLAEFADKELQTQSKIKAALAYPFFLALMGCVTVLVLLLFVIPKLTPVFDDLGQALPVPTLIIVGLSSFLIHFWWVVLFLIGAGLLANKRWKLFSGKNLPLDHFILQLPLLGSLLQKREIARFSRILGTLLTNGIPIIQSLEIASMNLAHPSFKKEIDQVKERVEKGEKLGVALQQCSHIPLRLSQMVSIGEETGKLEGTLLNLSDSYEKEIDRATKTFTSLLEPILILILGLVIAIIVIAMLLPIFNIHVGMS